MRRKTLATMLIAVGMATIGASAVEAAPQPVINSGFADRPVEPTRFAPGLAQQSPKALTLTPINNYVRRIKWSAWGKTEAVGQGEVSLLRGALGTELAPELPEETSPVTVRLGGLKQCLGVQAYTTYSLELAPGAEAPTGWPRGQNGTFPCHIVSASLDPTDRVSWKRCVYTGLKPAFDDFGGNPRFGYPRWQPGLPAKRAPTLDFCYLRPKDWAALSPRSPATESPFCIRWNKTASGRSS